MSKINDLVSTYGDIYCESGELGACIQQSGLYDIEKFVLRLSPKIHSILADTPKGIHRASDISFEQVQAFSTYLHETIHWWQHIGSTSGLLDSLAYPAQSHANIGHMRDFLRDIGPKKSIMKYCLLPDATGVRPASGSHIANVIVNNYWDIEFFTLIRRRPDLVDEIVKSPYFECVGHSFAIAYGNIITAISDMLDPEHRFIPDPQAWDPVFSDLRASKCQGFYYGSPIGIPPIGMREIFEGQALISQLQYIYFATGKSFSWEDARAFGMLHGIYVVAFNWFLKLIGEQWPERIGDPLVGLFLIVCDIAANPGEGFPFEISFHESFIIDNDPGTRFVLACHVIKNARGKIKSAITRYDKNEYIEVSSIICHSLKTPSPLDNAMALTNWPNNSESALALMRENDASTFSPVNMVVRLLTAKHIAFCFDKSSAPEVFCWPGAWMAGERISSSVSDIFSKHQAIFIDKEHDDGIFPAIPSGCNVENVQNTFQLFYNNVVVFDIVRQLISQDGPFSYEYRWLSGSHDKNDMANWAKKTFETAFGVNPDNFTIL